MVSTARMALVGAFDELARRAQFLLDFVEAENSTGFHARREAARLLTISIDDARRGEIALRGLTPPPPAAGPIITGQ